jgi:kynurenine formamidase
MKIIDLTRDMSDTLFVDAPEAKVAEIALQSANIAYTGVVYEFAHSSMAGTYIDFTGHIKECADGNDAGNYPVENLYRQDADIIQLDRVSGSGGVSAVELEAALQEKNSENKLLIINALGLLDSSAIEQRTVFLDSSAVEWIIAKKYRILISDIYESRELNGVFYELFKAGIITVCEPVNLNAIRGKTVKISIFPLRYAGITQLPCRVIAETES